MKRGWIALLLCLLVYPVFAQTGFQNNGSIPASKIENKSLKTGIPFASLNWNKKKTIRTGGIYFYSVNAPIDFNSLGIGWSSKNDSYQPGEYTIEYRYQVTSTKKWSAWKHSHGETSPSESPTGLYWSHLILTDYLADANELEVKINTPGGIDLQSIRFDVSNISNLGKGNPKRNSQKNHSRNAQCPAQPTIIPRADWWGSLPSDELSYPNATNSKTPSYNINTTHAYVHHGASSNNYTDGASVVRGYWSYHVNTRGWKDIGYNYVMDKFGNIYLARHNPNFPSQDVWGAHTSSSNPYSFAICFAGDYTSTQPSQVSLDNLYDFLAWKCDLRGLDPVGQGFIVSDTISIISGHRDAPGASTSCPGNILYAELPNIRITVKGKLDACADQIPPVTSISAGNDWQTADFNVSISDVDNESGVDQKFYQVTDNNGSEWRANGSSGFFNDNFGSTIHSDWQTTVGSWTINSGQYNQTNESSGNTNTSVAITQSAGSTYLYHWKMNLSGSGSNRRAGIHFYCDDVSQTNRGNSYFVYFRVDQGKVQLYKVTNNSWSLKTDIDVVVNANIWYDCKVIYDPSIGEIKVFQDNQLVTSWTDTSPHQTGGFVSLRTGNCNVRYDDLRVYRSRGTQVSVTVGANKDISYQSANLNSFAGMVYALSTDKMNNWSDEAKLGVKVDWSTPSNIAQVNDGISTDIDTTNDGTTLSANWTQSGDNNSGINKYYVSIGTSAGSADIAAWKSNGSATSFSEAGLSLVHGQKYFVNVKAENGAGLLSSIVSSDGQVFIDPSLISQSYCVSKSNNANYEWIANVSVGELNNASGKNVYTDFTATSVDLEQGSTYAVSLTPGFSGSTYNEYWRIWIDLNNDGNFDVNELVFDAGSMSSSTVTGNITILQSTVIGSYRMRVSMKYNGVPGPCETFAYGEVEDYTVNVIEPVVNVAAYCNSKGNNSSYEWINKVVIGPLIYTSGSDNGYADRTSISTDLEQGKTYQISLTPGFVSSTYNEYWKIWIDLNQDQDFDDAGELVYDQGGMSSSVITGSFAISANAPLGATRMRVTMKYNGSPASCETFAYGEVEDYTVNVVEPSITYCNSKGKNSNYEWIEKIRIGNFRESSGKNGGYADLTSRIIPISIGGPIPVTLTPGFSGTLYDEYWKIWIDLNVDGDFDDAGELVFDAGTLSKSIVTGNIVLPITVVPVETRLRISMKYNGAQTSCEVYSYGEVEDYTVNIGGVGKQATAIIEDIGDDEHFVIYPNPGKYDFVTVDLNWLRSNHELQLKVFDLTGKLVRIDFLNSGKLKYFLPISNLNNGIYKVVVTDGLTHKSLKLAVIR